MNPALLAPSKSALSGESWVVGGSTENELGVFEAYRTPGGGQLEREWLPGEHRGDLETSYSLWLPLPSRPVCCITVPEAKEQDTLREK